MIKRIIDRDRTKTSGADEHGLDMAKIHKMMQISANKYPNHDSTLRLERLQIMTAQAHIMNKISGAFAMGRMQ